MNENPIRELRVALAVEAYDTAFRFYRDSLKFPVIESWDRHDGRGVILDVHRATLEIVSEAQAAHTDQLEVGRRIAGPARLGFDVADTEAFARTFVDGGGVRVAGPVATRRSPKTFRLLGPEGMHYTLFTEAREGAPTVRELRITLAPANYDESVRFYRDRFGLPVRTSWSEPTGSGTIFEAGHATLELLSTKMVESVDRIEVGRRVSGPVRIAVEVEDSAKTGELLTRAGALLLGGPVITPWMDKNVRIRAPDGMQYTLFSKAATTTR